MERLEALVDNSRKSPEKMAKICKVLPCCFTYGGSYCREDPYILGEKMQKVLATTLVVA